MGAVFIKVLNMSLTAGWIVLAVLLVRLLFKKKAPKALFPILWAIVAVRLVCPVTFESNFSLIRNAEPVEQVELPEDFLQKETLHTHPEKETVPEGVEPVGFPEELPSGVEIVIVDTPEIGEGLTDVFEGVNETERTEPEGSGNTNTSESQSSSGKADSTIKETPFSVTYTETREDGTAVTVKRTDFSAIIAALWLCGIGSMLLYTAISYFRIYRQVRESALLAENVRVCDRIDSPFILGIVRPRIYLPSDIDVEDREFVLAHEKTHLKRLDHIWKPLGFLLLSVYWFHPLLWVAYILLCKDIEYACDEKVIKELGVEQKKTYSTALINCSVSRKMISACPLAFGENGVKGRVKSVLHYKKPAFWVMTASVMICVIMAVCFLTNPKGKDEKAKATPTPMPTSMITETPEVSPTPGDTNKNSGELANVINTTNISIAIGDEYAAYLDEEGKIHVLYDTSLIWEYDTVGATRGIDTTKTYKALGTDPWRLVAIDEEGKLSVSYHMTAEEVSEYCNQVAKDAADNGGTYGLGGIQSWMAKDFEEMTGVKQIFSTYPYSDYTALFEDGTVYYYGIREDINELEQITDNANGVVAGLKADGTLVMTEVNDVLRKKKLDTWPEKLKQIEAGYNFLVGLKLDGTVISEGVEQEYMINSVEQWTGIIKIAVANETVVGLKGDGTVVAVCPARSDKGQCEVDDWTDVIAVNTNGSVTVGITKDGKVLMAGDVPEIVQNLPEYYNYEEIKSLLLEYLNHQAWLYPSEYPQESFQCSYELYCMTSDSTLKRVFLKAVIGEKEYWFDFQQDELSNPDSPVRIVAREPQVEHYIEEGSIVRIGSDKIYVPAVKQPVYEENVDFTEEISTIYADLKANGYRDDLRIEVIVSACDMEKKLFPYVYLIINDSEVYETTFTDEYTLSRTFFDDNYYIDYSLNYGTGGAWLFDGHGIKPLGSVDARQFERVKACASFHKIFIENDTEVVMIDGEEVSVPNTNVTINGELGVGIAFLPQWSLSNIVHYNIYRSEDSGKSWRMIAEDVTATEGDIARILIPESDTIVCYFDISGTTSQSSCMMSEDGGATWKYATYVSKPNASVFNPQKDTSVIFGAYEQDGDISNGTEPLEWLVLDRNGDRALLLAKYGIETMLFDKNESVHPWSDSELYRIINRELYQYAFSEEERAALLQTNTIKDSSLALSADMERLFYHGYTFLPETDDVLYGQGQDETAFFRTEESRITIPTAYAAQKGAWLNADGEFTGVTAPWLLTVTGTTDGDFLDVKFARVMRDGKVSFEEDEIKDEYVLIRPAIWVDVTKIPQQ